MTSPGRREAEDYLATIRADVVRGLGKPPELAAITLADDIASLLSVRVDLAPKTLQLYEELARLWIDADHQLPSPSARDGAGRTRTINLGERELGALTVAVIRDWYAAAVHTTDQRAARRASDQSSRADSRAREQVHAARAWALDNGLRVGTAGRLPAAAKRLMGSMPERGATARTVVRSGSAASSSWRTRRSRTWRR